MNALVFFMLLLITAPSFSTTLTVGVIRSAPPFSEMTSADKGAYFFGFSIDIMNDICRRIGQTCVYSPVTLETQLQTLDKGSIDLLLLASPYTKAQLNQYASSLPYAVSKVQFVSLKTNPIHSNSEIKNLRIGVIKSTFYNLLTQTPFKDSNQIITYDLVADLLSDLTQNKIDVIVLNSAIANDYINNDLYNLKIVGNEIPLGEGYGIIGLPDKADLIKEINKALVSMQMDGTYVSIYQKYYNDH